MCIMRHAIPTGALKPLETPRVFHQVVNQHHRPFVPWIAVVLFGLLHILDVPENDLALILLEKIVHFVLNHVCARLMGGKNFNLCHNFVGLILRCKNTGKNAVGPLSANSRRFCQLQFKVLYFIVQQPFPCWYYLNGFSIGDVNRRLLIVGDNHHAL